MNKIFCVSFPRSGSTWLKFALHHAMQEKFRYCDSHQEIPDYERHNWIKSHDFNLDVEPPSGFTVLYQTRASIDAVPSWWNLQVRDGLQTDSYDNWINWAPSGFEFWKRLHAKWAPRSDMIIWMEDLKLFPLKHLLRVGTFMDPEFKPALGPLLPEFVQSSSAETFQHYRKEDFTSLATLAA